MSTTKTGDDPAGVAADPGPGLAVGDCLAGRYLLTRFIAAGGMGEVFAAEDRLLDQRVAIKSIRPAIARDRRALARFRREVLLARKVTHRNVCRVFELAHEPRADGEVPFLVMELLAGETLAARLARTGRLTAAEALPIAVQLAAALDAAHDAGVLHRDFKSANVMLADRPVVTDFGLARSHDPHEPAGAADGGMSGTPSSMAPEQLAGRPTSPATDVYAFGVVLFEMVTGAAPFAGQLRHPDQPAPAARSLVPDLDPRWDAMITRCLALDPADRPARAGQVAAALQGTAIASRRRGWIARVAAILVVAAGAWVRAGAGAPGPAATEELAASGEREFEAIAAEFFAQVDAHQLPEARATLDRLRELPLTSHDEDIRCDILEGHLADAIGDHRSMQAAASRAAVMARRRGRKELLAIARDAEQWALYNLGEPQRMREALEEVRQLRLELGDGDGAVRMVAGLATLAMERGELAEARRLIDEVLAHFRSQGFERIAGALGSIAEIELRRGRLDEVDRTLEQLAPFRDRPTYRPQFALHALLDGRRSELRGDLTTAHARFATAEQIYREFDDNQRLAGALLALGRVLEQQGDLLAARSRLEEAHTIFKTLGIRRMIADSQSALARLALAEGRPAVAESLAREADVEMARQGALDGQALAAALRARATAALGRPVEATRLLAPHLARRSESAEVRTRLAIAAGDPALLDAVLRDDRDAGLVLLEREALAARAALP